MLQIHCYRTHWNSFKLIKARSLLTWFFPACMIASDSWGNLSCKNSSSISSLGKRDPKRTSLQTSVLTTSKRELPLYITSNVCTCRFVLKQYISCERFYLVLKVPISVMKSQSLNRICLSISSCIMQGCLAKLKKITQHNEIITAVALAIVVLLHLLRVLLYQGVLSTTGRPVRCPQMMPRVKPSLLPPKRVK